MMNSKIFQTKMDIIKEIAFYLNCPVQGIDKLERVDYMTLLNILTRLEGRDRKCQRK